MDEGKLPVYRGIKLSKDDKIRKHLMNDLRTYFKIEFKEIENIFKINFKEYFDTELKSLTEHVKDKLVLMSPQYVEITELGRHFAPQIANVFDKYDPPSNSYSKRLEKINSVAVHPS